ncbi:hypothetical protein [uncultured Methylobacterium sp.]|jgi:hypothetical protein|uniref:hypothetical protein n=1 Tax=uncultured Methylobacterium sp. TaxID=157278 RepID=UPI0026173EE8|nr:hypothetical protein [uncultured Methylobacterium sp.]
MSAHRPQHPAGAETAVPARTAPQERGAPPERTTRRIALPALAAALRAGRGAPERRPGRRSFRLHEDCVME